MNKTNDNNNMQHHRRRRRRRRPITFPLQLVLSTCIFALFAELIEANLDICSTETETETTREINATTPFCAPFHILSDSRGYATPFGQCRTLCTVNGITTTTESTPCSARCPTPDTCIPLSQCLEDCGPIPRNCIYSGTCGSLHCFATTPYRFTHSGLGSILNAEDRSEIQSHIPLYIQNSEDECGMPLTRACERDDIIMKDGRMNGRNGQCRSLCSNYKNENVEVIPLETKCKACKSTNIVEKYIVNAPLRDDIDEDLKINYYNNEKHTCIPSDVCKSECGDLPHDGCIYSGDCAWIFCFSTLDSKNVLPLNVVNDINDDGTNIVLNDFTNDPKDRTFIDPPIFNTKQNTFVQSSVPDPTTLNPSPTPSITPTGNVENPSNTVDPTSTPENTDTDDNSNADGADNATVCIGVKHLSEIHDHQLVFKTHQRSFVLCDSLGSCATPHHMVQYHQKSMTMAEYCGTTECQRKVMFVNSPKYQKGFRISSSTDGLSFTTFAATYGTKLESLLLSVVIKLGF